MASERGSRAYGTQTTPGPLFVLTKPQRHTREAPDATGLRAGQPQQATTTAARPPARAMPPEPHTTGRGLLDTSRTDDVHTAQRLTDELVVWFGHLVGGITSKYAPALGPSGFSIWRATSSQPILVLLTRVITWTGPMDNWPTARCPEPTAGLAPPGRAPSRAGSLPGRLRPVRPSERRSSERRSSERRSSAMTDGQPRRLHSAVAERVAVLPKDPGP